MSTERSRALLIGVQLPDVSEAEHQASLDELGRLADTLGLEVIARISQRRDGLSRGAVVGRGKLLEIARYTGGSGVIPSAAGPRSKTSNYIPTRKPSMAADDDVDAPEELDESGDEAEDEGEVEPGDLPKMLPSDKRATVIVVDHDLSPSQARNLEKAVDAEVFDRTAIILAIFQRHARTREAKLEVEIARLAYMAPRLREVGGGGDRQRGGVGGRGAGESSIELDRRKVRDRIAELRKELEEIDETARIRRRKRSDHSTVALVGYTNAGKSSMMRALTGSDVYVADKLFATLDTTIRVLKPETKPRILVSDTVGFIKKLPHGLVASFRATLDAASESDLLLHIVDAADAAYASQLKVTKDLLAEIGAGNTASLLILNKIDLVDKFVRASLLAKHPDAILMSSRDAQDVAALRQRIIDYFEREMADGELFIPYARGAFISEIHGAGRVVEEKYEEEGVRMRVRALPHVLDRLKRGAGETTPPVLD